MDPQQYDFGDVSITVDGAGMQGYHRLLVEADDSYRVEFWKDGCFSRTGLRHDRMRKNRNPGKTVKIHHPPSDTYAAASERISPGRAADTSHRADVYDLDADTAAAAQEAITDYLTEQGDTEAQDAVEQFFTEHVDR